MITSFGRKVLALPLAAALFLCARDPEGSEKAATESQPTGALRAYDLDGRPINPFGQTNARAFVFLFVKTDCPISNRYAPEVNRLQERFANSNLQFWLVYPDPATPPEDVKRHMRDYGYKFSALRDSKHALVKYSGATTTPEAAVFTREGRLLYRGRIDDRFPTPATARAAATEHDLENALLAFLSGKPVVRRITPAVGCLIGDLP